MTSQSVRRSPLFQVMMMVLAVGSAMLLASCKQDLSADQRWLETATRQIVQDHRELAELTAKQHEQAQSFCRAPSEAGLAKMQERWRKSMAAWQRLQWLRLGPITHDNDDWKLQFWPDKKNILQRKIQVILDGTDPVTADTLSHASVVVQGFSAQELLLFDAGFASVEKFQSRQCDLIMASTALTAKVAGRLADAWQDKSWLQTWFSPAVTHEGVTPAQTRDGELLDALLAQSEKIKAAKLGEPMGLKTRDKKPNGYFSESWRSQNSLANIHSNLAAFQQLATPKQGYGLFQYLKDKKHDDIAEQLVIHLDNVLLAMQQIQLPLSQAVMDPSQQDALQASVRSLGELETFLKKQLAPALELSLGFNSNDGD